ncbi:MAG: amidohydrolase family protein [Acidobacteria bacterium]|nr:amidohydrolase family protein [Acidobacteriota bacterium]
MTKALSSIGLLVLCFHLGVKKSEGAGIVIYPDTIYFNAKIVTVDDASTTSRIGTIVQAMAIKDGKIVLIGNNAAVLDSAGPNTKKIDLKGRTVAPGVIASHEHPTDWQLNYKELMLHVVPKEVAVQRWLSGPPRRQLDEFSKALEEAVKEASPGQWVRMNFDWGDGYSNNSDPFFQEGGDRGTKWAGEIITKEMMDRIAPNNPVYVRGAAAVTLRVYDSMLNSKGIEEVDKALQGDPRTVVDPGRGAIYNEKGVTGLNYRVVEPDVIFKDHFDVYMEVLKQGFAWDTGIGITTYGGFLHGMNQIRAYKILAERGELPARLAWGHGNLKVNQLEYFFTDRLLLADLATRAGEGNDLMWFYGMGNSNNSGASLPLLPGRTAQRSSSSTYGPDSPYYKFYYDYVKMGGRLMAYHTMGDMTVDQIFQLIQKASQEGGLSEEQIRSKKHTADHMVAWPRPDQVPILKQLGMIPGGTNSYAWDEGKTWMRDYGEKVVERMLPRKSVHQGGVMTTFENDRPFGKYPELNVFDGMYWMVSRKGPDGTLWAQSEAISREEALKASTIWGAYYVLREKVLGSLEQGKWADFMVLDKDYLTVPVEEIANIHPLMTVVGGKVQHLVPSLARELGMQPMGPVVLWGAAGKW